MQTFFFRLRRFLSFYRQAVTKYQLHSPFVFELAVAVLENRRWYYAYRDVEMLRRKMLESDVRLSITDYGTGASRHASVRQVARTAGSPVRQGRLLFLLAEWAAPSTMLELGTSLGISAMYLASGKRSARFISLEGCADCAQVARTNLDILQLKNAEVHTGPFAETLPAALQTLQTLDFVFFDGDHRLESTLRYFEQCLTRAHAKTVFVFDDMHWSPEMAQAWDRLKQHPSVTLSVDFFDVSLVFINPEFHEKQHFNIVPKAWKPWKVF